MATARAQDTKILTDSLRRFKQGLGSSSSMAEKRRRYAFTLQAIRTLPMTDPAALPILGHPSMALFKAVMEGPKALELACQAAEDSLIDMPLPLATAAAGVKPELGNIRLSSSLKFNALQFCAHLDMWREARVLLAHGANPNCFNAEVTPIGLAAYAGSARVLCEMISFGANATLYLPPEHAPHAPSAHGSTLLHRVANRPIGDNKMAVLLILAHCAASYPDPLPLTLDGKTPLDWADDDEARSALLSAVSDREANALRSATPTRRAPSAKIRI
jgi:hypothetical protein